MPKKHTAKQVKGELHPRSRKSVQLKRTLLRADKLTTKKAERAISKASPIVDRFTWFKLILDDDQKILTEDGMHELVLLYISRFDEELEALRSTLRPGRPIPKRMDEIEFAGRQETQEYESTGFLMPEMRDAKSMEALRKWNGEYNSLHVVKQIRLVAQKQ